MKKDLKLSERNYHGTECERKLNRDKNASIKLANAKAYQVALKKVTVSLYRWLVGNLRLWSVTSNVSRQHSVVQDRHGEAIKILIGVDLSIFKVAGSNARE